MKKNKQSRCPWLKSVDVNLKIQPKYFWKCSSEFKRNVTQLKIGEYTGCGISQLTFHADNECKNEAKAQIVTC
jgi:hypothetical protein